MLLRVSVLFQSVHRTLQLDERWVRIVTVHDIPQRVKHGGIRRASLHGHYLRIQLMHGRSGVFCRDLGLGSSGDDGRPFLDTRAGALTFQGGGTACPCRWARGLGLSRREGMTGSKLCRICARLELSRFGQERPQLSARLVSRRGGVCDAFVLVLLEERAHLARHLAHELVLLVDHHLADEAHVAAHIFCHRVVS